MQIEPIYQLTQAQYEELLAKQTEPSDTLRETNQALKSKVDELTKQLAQGSFDRAVINSPVVIRNDKLCLSAISEFVTMYNHLATRHKCTDLKSADAIMQINLEILANTFNYEPYFSNISDVKRYRVELHKKSMYTNAKRNKLIQLIPSGD